MLHVWQASLQGELRVWQTASNTWRVVPNWQAIQDDYDDKTVCLYVPSQSVLQLVCSLPAAQLKQLGNSGQQYLFEDIALTPVEQLRVRLLPDTHEDKHVLYAAATNDVAGWQNSADLVDLDIVALIPDVMLLPAPEYGEGVLQGSKATLYHDDETTLIRQSENVGFAVSYLPLLLKSLPQLQELDVLPVFNGSLSQPASYQTQLNEVLDTKGILVHTLSALPTPIQSPHRHPLNFIEKVNQSKLSPYMKIAMLTALCAGVIQMSADALQAYQYKQATAQVMDATNAQFSSWVAGESLNPRVEVMTQMRPYLVTDGAKESVQLATLERISPLIKQSDISTQSLSWDDKMVTLHLVSPERQGLDRLMSALVAQGIAVSLGRIEPRADGSIIGEVKVDITPQTPIDPA